MLAQKPTQGWWITCSKLDSGQDTVLCPPDRSVIGTWFALLDLLPLFQFLVEILRHQLGQLLGGLQRHGVVLRHNVFNIRD